MSLESIYICFLLFETQSLYIAQAGLNFEVMIHFSKSWLCRHRRRVLLEFTFHNSYNEKVLNIFSHMDVLPERLSVHHVCENQQRELDPMGLEL